MREAVGDLEVDEQELQTHLEGNKRVFDEAKEMRARIKERKAAVCDLMSEHDLDEYVGGDRVFTRTSAPKVMCNQKRLEMHMGPAAFEEYAAANVEVDEKVNIKKRKKTSSAQC